MATKISNFSQGATGNASIAGVPFLPTSVEFYVAQKTSTTENFAHYSSGVCNGLTQMAHSIYWDSTGGSTKSFFDRSVHHMNRVAGTLTDIIRAEWVSFDTNGGGDFGFTLHFTAADANYKIYFIARS